MPFIFLYCPSPVTVQKKNESMAGRTGRVVFTFSSRDTLDGLKMLVRSNSSYYRVPFFPSGPLSDDKSVLISHVPYICSQERKQSLNKDRSTVKDKDTFPLNTVGRQKRPFGCKSA